MDARIKKTLQKLTEFDRYEQSIYVYMAPPFKDAEHFKLSKYPFVKVLNYSKNTEFKDSIIINFVNELKGQKL